MGQMVIEKALPHLNLRDIRFKSNRMAVLHCNFLDLLDGRVEYNVTSCNSPL